ncbi:hypothetical protein [Methylocystis echinoides]|uniref:Uncharacterized protein n=1 Tax=Methylocystis echinoides TaxID=29468 RepID=A0A9W6LSF6_9HYPH|nr:hypothetical protein [Methylocystis echinoides]GLI93635.1 hypothetical protein LMG27198_26270 [Methylocystis echinoides]
MEDPLPKRTDGPRPIWLRRRAGSDRLTTVLAAEAAAGRAGPEPATAKGPTEQRMATLATALRRARMENADHSAAVADLRAAEVVRLELLADAIAPVLAQAPEDCDLFDLAISPGERPRLFIDCIGFVEMDRDRRTYRFLQDTRHARIVLCESADIDEMVEAATNYVAHRLIEREKALAIDYASGGAARVVREATAPKPAPASGKAFQAFLFFVELLGSAAFFSLLAVLAMWAYRTYFEG